MYSHSLSLSLYDRGCVCAIVNVYLARVVVVVVGLLRVVPFLFLPPFEFFHDFHLNVSESPIKKYFILF